MLTRLFQVITRPKHIFLVPGPSNRALKLAQQLSWGSYRYYVPEISGSSASGKTIALPLECDPEHNTYRLGYDYAQSILQQIRRLMPGFFDFGWLDVEGIFRFHLQFRLAYYELPLLYPYFKTRAPESEAPLHLIDTHLSPDLVQTFLQDMNLPLPPRNMYHHATLTPKRLARELNRTHGALPALPPIPPEETGGVLAILHYPGHLSFLQPALEVLSRQHRIHVLLSHPSTMIPEAFLPPDSRQKAFSSYLLEEIPPLTETAVATRAVLTKHLAHIRALPDKADQTFLLNQIPLLQSVLKKAMACESLISHLKPAWVSGCMDYNSYGPVLSQLKKKLPFRSLNLQHGFNAPSWTADLLDFDAYFAWNRQTVDLLQEEQYPRPDNVHLVGNPNWESLAEKIRCEPPSQPYQTLMAWKGEAPLIGAYTQALQGYSTLTRKQDYLKSLSAYLKATPNVKLLVKKHPLESDTAAETTFADPGWQNRVWISKPGELALWESLKAVDVVTTIFSATLTEGMALRKPVVALDFERTLERQNIDLQGAAWILHEPAQVQPVLDHLLGQSRDTNISIPAPTYDRLEAIVPTLPGSYRERITDILLRI